MEPTLEEKKRREEEIFRLLVGGKLDPDVATILSMERSLSRCVRVACVSGTISTTDAVCASRACRAKWYGLRGCRFVVVNER